VGFYQEYESEVRLSFDASAGPAATAKPVKGDRQVRLFEIVDILKGALDLFEEAALAFDDSAAGLADNEVVYRAFEYELIPTPFACDTQLLDDAERLQHLKISVDA
jgi:hypothetical protein